MPPASITAVRCARSPGKPDDYYSEGDYWWPDLQNPGGPFVRRDGHTNPQGFFQHRWLLLRFARHVAALVAAFQVTRNARYAHHAVCHLRAWFVDAPTRMNPSLHYAQAIPGVCTGRGIGLIDTIHLAEVARAVIALDDGSALCGPDRRQIKAWFGQYLGWLVAHPYGVAERHEKNNHGTCWYFQAAAFARLVEDEATLSDCRRAFEQTLLPDQMGPDGSFPLELARTKPYAYSIFNLDVLAGLCQLVSTPDRDLWRFETPSGHSLAKGLAFLFPYLQDKLGWPHAHDVMYWDAWPVRQPCLLFGGLALRAPAYLTLWQTLEPDPREPEIRRNLPIRQPLLWLGADEKD